MNTRRLFYIIFLILPLWIVLGGSTLAQNKEEEKKKEEEEEVMPAPVEVPEESGAFDKGFAKEMPDEGGLAYSPELLLASFTAKSEKKDEAMKLAKDGAIKGLSQQIDQKLDAYKKSIKKEKLKNEKEITALFSNAGELSKKELLQKPAVIDSTLEKKSDGWEASIMLELKVSDLSKKLLDGTKDDPEFKKTKLYKEISATAKEE